MDTNNNTTTGIVTEALPNTMFRVRVPKTSNVELSTEVPSLVPAKDYEEIIAYLGGKMKFNRIRVIVGDLVELLLDEYGGKARITRRKTVSNFSGPKKSNYKK